ncbi:MAG TPA: shikimate dehydrogenase [Bacillota bacterium]|nr:shikimate dehydrogenase [Bacillota bacterium]HPX69659.1 shikimate dehydrogenase [Bacillota bacterium]HQA64654.1 shikimate dehydrogenase [Bacillota bacterium]HQO41783.1 shikimate dehydrogenase [Bacillota bacterium]HQQ44674.1 shikimate dehydrogenase [Bacillota bacterium]
MMNNVFGLIGESLRHSFSPQIHCEIFKMLGIEGEYRLFELQEEELEPALLKYREQGIKGLNVTVPYKIKIMPYLDVISEEAEKIGAVNTISLANDVLTGYNTDYRGFGMLLARSNIEVKNKTAVILGTGGVSKAAAQYLMDNGVKRITYVSRNPGDGAVGYDETESLKGDIIINCTPCGMYPKADVSPVPYGTFKQFGTAVDLIYNPEKTMFLKQAEENGLKAVNGLYMLVGQAVAAQEIWNGIGLSRSQVDNIYQHIKKMLYKADTSKNIVLIGLSGCGKTSIGRLLAEKLERKFIDIDDMIEKQEGCTINELFRQGEEHFRNLETKAVLALEREKALVISTGGGVVKRAVNMKSLKKNGIIIFIDRDVCDIMDDIDTSTRPLLAGGTGRLLQLHAERYDLYKEYSDFTVCNDSKAADIIEDIYRKLVEKL